MELKELDSIIENSASPKKDIDVSIVYYHEDNFAIKSIVYNQVIYIGTLASIDEMYRKVTDRGISLDIFNQPFYLIVHLEDFNDKTINILNNLDKSILIEIVINNYIGPKEIEFLLKIKNDNINIYLSYESYLNLETMKLLISRYKINIDYAVLVIDKIDSNTADYINSLISKYPNLRFKIEIKDLASLKNLSTILPFIPEDEILIYLDDTIFSDKNPNNIRNIILQQDFSLDLKIPEGKKIEIFYNGLEYKSLEDIINLEKYLEIIKSHIPSDASELDIVSYVSLFIANYFTYDYEEYKIEKQDITKAKLINLTDFITSRKGVCRDYAAFTKYLLTSLNIACEVIETDSEFLDEHPEIGHAFNLVRIEGKDYFLDNTWLAEDLQDHSISSLEESPFFLTSNDDFQHDDYKTILDRYHCETMDREEVAKSVNRVLKWNNNYVIHLQALKDLIRKYVLKKQISIERQIEDAIIVNGR